MDASIERAREAEALMVHMRALLREQEEKAAAAAAAAIKSKPIENGIPVTCPCGVDIQNADAALQKMKKKMRAMRRGRI